MVADVEYFEPVGGGPGGIGALIKIGSAGGVSFWDIDVGPVPPGGAGPEHLSAQVLMTSRREAAKAEGGGEL